MRLMFYFFLYVGVWIGVVGFYTGCQCCSPYDRLLFQGYFNDVTLTTTAQENWTKFYPPQGSLTLRVLEKEHLMEPFTLKLKWFSSPYQELSVSAVTDLGRVLFLAKLVSHSKEMFPSIHILRVINPIDPGSLSTILYAVWSSCIFPSTMGTYHWIPHRDGWLLRKGIIFPNGHQYYEELTLSKNFQILHWQLSAPSFLSGWQPIIQFSFTDLGKFPPQEGSLQYDSYHFIVKPLTITFSSPESTQ